jgi:hypothetical protein
MTLDDICRMTGREATLRALRACRSSHEKPWINQWRNALTVASRDPAINSLALAWLSSQARRWDQEHAQT